jgi:hypothetical protein
MTFSIANTRKLGVFAGAKTWYKQQNLVGCDILDCTMQESVPHATVTCQLDFQ